MPGNIHKAVKQKKNPADERGVAESLIRPLTERKSAPDEQNRRGRNQNERRPPHLGGHPNPIALRVERPLGAARGIAKKSENALEISQADPAPGRALNHHQGVPKSQPPKIG